MSDTNKPVLPDYALTCIQAYGDARADDDGTSAEHLRHAITELRAWCAAAIEAAVAEVNALNGALTDKCNSYIIANARLAEQVAEERAVPKPAVRTDTARLDMLESDKMMRVFKIGKTWYWKPAYGMPHRKAKTLREAIDAALGAGCARVAVCACDEQGEPGVTCGDCPSDYGHCVTPSPTPAAEQPKAAVREEALFDAIKDVLLHHRMSYTEGEDAEAFPLVDMLCPPGSRDISKGHDEITLICDAIYNDEAVRAALSGEQP